jgi:epoxyqueuosine reductase
LRERIREAALAQGFQAVGFARAEPHPDGARVASWVEGGRHGTMAWMAREPAGRGDPERLLPGARTVISAAAGYYLGARPGAPEAGTEPATCTEPEGEAGLEPEAGGPRGTVARYAWGRDYHKRMKRKLLRLAATLRALAPGARWTTAVDARPFLDRAWAERAGLGWIGKNTNVILKGAGSWCFLGAVVTDLAIEPDPPARNYCGTCARCMTACPTGAITGPYRLDARRCISYLTIEHEGAIPLEMRPLIGTRIFGCDDCQEVCPWNRFAVRTADPAFQARPGQEAPELIPLLDLDEAAFRERFEGTALRRAGRDRFVRNVAVALGNAGDPRALPALERAAAHDPDAGVREHAAWALARIRAAGRPNPT